MNVFTNPDVPINIIHKSRRTHYLFTNPDVFIYVFTNPDVLIIAFTNPGVPINVFISPDVLIDVFTNGP